jgi:hypothetical protein
MFGGFDGVLVPVVEVTAKPKSRSNDKHIACPARTALVENS